MPEIRALISRPSSASETMPTKPRMASRKYSGGPNLSAKIASRGAVNKRTVVEKTPPVKLEITDTLSAKPPLPCWVKG